MRDHDKLIWIAGVLALSGGALLFAFGQNFYLKIPASDKEPISMATDQKVLGAPQRLYFLGDVMLSRQIGQIALKNDDFAYHARLAAPIFNEADLVMANLENPVSTRGQKMGSIYSFRAAPEMLETLKALRVSIVTLANNHIYDFGPEATLDTFAHLSLADIGYVGAGVDYETAHQAVIKEVKGTKIAFLGYTNLIPVSVTTPQSKPAVAFIDETTIKQDVAAIREMVDLVIVNFHWGEEYKTSHNDFQAKVAEDTLAAGADLVVGHHPHVVQELVGYENGWVAYSLGNFIFDQNFSKDTEHGLVLEVTIKDKKIIAAQTHEVLFTKDFQPYFSNKKSGQPQNRRLQYEHRELAP